VADRIRLKGGPHDGKWLKNDCEIRRGDYLHIVEARGQRSPGDHYLVYETEARHVANRPISLPMLFATNELEEA
jgi:hypothetical protein